LTGATGGLGRAMASALADEGASVILSGRRREELEALAAELSGDGHRVAPADLAEPGAAVKLAEEAGDVDVLVANAGLPGTGRMDEQSDEQIQATLRVNLEAPILLARHLLPGMRSKGEGHLIFVASLSGKAASPRASIYNATKFGLRGYALALRADLAPDGIGVSIVSPGFIRGAGMFASSGAKPPPGLGTSTPDKVGAGLIRAIKRNRAEVAVAPLRQRAISHFALAAPGASTKAQSGKAGQRSAQSVHEGHMKRK
jgi:short-subunit dehydrogenase